LQELINHFANSIILRQKGSYLKKHIALTGMLPESQQGTPKRFRIDTITQEIFAEGKVLLLDKPVHWTSFDVVKKLRSLLRIKKIGHAGTLDPLASGLLIICTGKYTKKINEFMAQEKEYTGAITIGAVTPTYDLESLPEQQKDYSGITESMIHEAAKKFVGEIEQLPPVYSALKKAGTPLYELARRGEEIELKPRKINIQLFEITSIELPVIHFKVISSTGTYIRSLANDVGQVLGCGGYLSELRRTAIGETRVDEAISVTEFIEELEVLQGKSKENKES
jgi:tRNA pseudouridine55 synthase